MVTWPGQCWPEPSFHTQFSGSTAHAVCTCGWLEEGGNRAPASMRGVSVGMVWDSSVGRICSGVEG